MVEVHIAHMVPQGPMDLIKKKIAAQAAAVARKKKMKILRKLISVAYATHV